MKKTNKPAKVVQTFVEIRLKNEIDNANTVLRHC